MSTNDWNEGAKEALDGILNLMADLVDQVEAMEEPVTPDVSERFADIRAQLRKLKIHIAGM